jgi:hypothetical protein
MGGFSNPRLTQNANYKRRRDSTGLIVRLIVLSVIIGAAVYAYFLFAAT